MQPGAQILQAQHSQFPYVAGPTSNPADKLLFFDRAKRTLDREVYEEFLKLLSLFSKEIINIKTLVERVKVFFEGDLLADFKDLVGWDDRLESVEYGPPGSIRTGPPEALQAQPADDGEGPSYRRLPESVSINAMCSTTPLISF
jgi:paired amphipathic helix protein Sin3a